MSKLQLEPDKIKLNELVNKVTNIQIQLDSLTAEKDELVTSIIKELTNLKIDEFIASNKARVHIFNKTTFKYSNEKALIEWLETNKHTKYIKKAVDKTALNKELRNTTPIKLVEKLNLEKMYTETITTAFKLDLPK